MLAAASPPATTSPRSQRRSLRKKTTKEQRMKNKHDKRPVEPQKEPGQVRESEEEVEQGKMETYGAVFPLLLPPYIPPRKPNEKLVKELKHAKYGTFTPLLSESVQFTRETLLKILQLKFMEYDFNDINKYPQFTPDRYLKQTHYPGSGVITLEP